jgi:uncharacterized protein YacL (UPF0231 family)
MNLITETKGKLEYHKKELSSLQECIEKPVTKDCMHHLREEIKKTKERIEYYSKTLEVLEKSSKNTEWELGTNGKEYFLFLQKENLNTCMDISEIDAKVIEKLLGVKAVEYPF